MYFVYSVNFGTRIISRILFDHPSLMSDYTNFLDISRSSD